MPPVPPRYRGASDQASPDAGRDAVAGGKRRRCGATSPSRRFKPRGSWRACRTSWGTRWYAAVSSSGAERGAEPPNGGELIGDEPNRRTDYHRGPRGADLETPCAGRLGSGGLAVNRTSACLDAARRRGPWVRRDPRVARAPSVLSRRRKAVDGRGPARGRPKNTGDEPRPLFDRRTGESVRERRTRLAVPRERANPRPFFP